MAQGDMAAFEQLVTARRSIRAFLPRAVEPAVLERIFLAAQRAPSNCNTQPWSVHVASGGTLAALRKALPEAFAVGDLSLDYPYDGTYPGVFRERQHAAAQALYTAAGIARSDREGRDTQFRQNFRFFDAPHVAFLFLPEVFGLREAADVGMYAQNLMLAITAHGLGSCPQTSLGFLAEPVREILGVEAGLKLLFGISFGYPDWSAPVNECQTTRAELSTVVTFHQ
ncbi:nitroreductase [Haliea sp. E17]